MKIQSWFFSALFLLAFNSSFASPPKDIKKIIDSGKLVIAMHKDDRIPFFMHDGNSHFIGYDVEIAEDIAKKLGVKAEFLRSAKYYDDVVTLVEKGEADIGISKLSFTPDRSLKVLCTNLYATLQQVAIMNRTFYARKSPTQTLESYLNRKDVKIGVLARSSYAYFAQSMFPLATMVPFENIVPLYEAIPKGSVNAVYHEEVTANNWLYEHPSTVIQAQVVPLPGRIDPSTMIVQWNNIYLLTWLNTYLEVAKNDGTLDKLRQKYLKSNDWRKNPKN